MTLWKKIDKLTKEKGWSYYRLERNCGLALGTTAGWRTRRTRPSLESVISIIKVFGITFEELMRGVDKI